MKNELHNSFTTLSQHFHNLCYFFTKNREYSLFFTTFSQLSQHFHNIVKAFLLQQLNCCECCEGF